VSARQKVDERAPGRMCETVWRCRGVGLRMSVLIGARRGPLVGLGDFFAKEGFAELIVGTPKIPSEGSVSATMDLTAAWFVERARSGGGVSRALVINDNASDWCAKSIYEIPSPTGEWFVRPELGLRMLLSVWRPSRKSGAEVACLSFLSFKKGNRSVIFGEEGGEERLELVRDCRGLLVLDRLFGDHMNEDENGDVTSVSPGLGDWIKRLSFCF